MSPDSDRRPAAHLVPTGNTYDKEGTTNPVESRLVTSFTDSLMELLPGKVTRVLEVGCGEGNQLRRIAAALPATKIFGMDLPDPDLTAKWPEIEARMFTGSVTDLPAPDDTFDLVLAIEVLEHIDDHTAALREIARVATGTVILSVPWEPVWRLGNMARGRYIAQLGNTPGHVNHFTRRGFIRSVAQFFDVQTVRRPFPWTMVKAGARSR